MRAARRASTAVRSATSCCFLISLTEASLAKRRARSRAILAASASRSFCRSRRNPSSRSSALANFSFALWLVLSRLSVRFQHTAPIIFRRLDKALFRCWLRPHFEHHQGTIPNLEWRLVASIGDHTGFSYCRVIGPRPQFCGPTTDVTGIYAEAAHHSRASRFGWRPNHHRSSITPQRPHGSAGGG